MIPLILIDAKTDRSAALEQYLTGTGTYRVITSDSPEVTLNRNLIESDAIVIVVHDEGQDGLLFLKNLRERKVDFPVIILATSYDPGIFSATVAHRAEYMVMNGPADIWYPVLLQIIAKVSADLQVKARVAVLEKKLNLVGSVTRHDILNQLTAVSGYTELLEMVVEDPQMKSYIGKVRFALEKIRRQFQFAKDYQNLGSEPPRWQTIDSVIRRARDSVSLPGVTIKEPDRTVSVFADLSIEKAMAQLLDNAVRHGKHVSQIVIGVLETADGATIVVEDNGEGIPLSDKERIFERGFGKHTGWGLFLTRETLALTGLKIVETGEPGKGARFEIHIPAESYKKQGA